MQASSWRCFRRLLWACGGRRCSRPGLGTPLGRPRWARTQTTAREDGQTTTVRDEAGLGGETMDVSYIVTSGQVIDLMLIRFVVHYVLD